MLFQTFLCYVEHLGHGASNNAKPITENHRHASKCKSLLEGMSLIIGRSVRIGGLILTSVLLNYQAT